MRLYFDTSVIGALFDTEMPQRMKITRVLLNSVVEDKHIGVISNILLEEVERSPEEVREKLLTEMRKIPFQVISEDETSTGLLEIYEQDGVLFVKQPDWI